MQRSAQQQGTATYLLACVALLSLLLGGCRQRNNQASEEVAVSPTPTATAIQVVAVPTFSPTSEPTATNSPVPTPLPGFNVNANASLRSGPGDDFDVAGEIRAGERVMPTARSDDGNWVRLPQGWIRADAIDDLPLSGLPIDVPTPNLVLATVNIELGANVRAGPGTDFRVVELLEHGVPVEPIARTRDARWIQLTNGGWVFSQLLDNVPANLPTAQNIPPTPTPTPTATLLPTSTPAFTPTPTPTPDPRISEWNTPTLGKRWSKQLDDGLQVRTVSFIYNSEEFGKYFQMPAGQRCNGCIVIGLELKNVGGKTQEYIALQDFELLKSLTSTPYMPDSCPAHPQSLHNTPPGPVTKLAINQSRVVYICFNNLEDTPDTIELHYRLSYKNVYIDQSQPAATPTNIASDVVWSSDPAERDQDELQGWTVYFRLPTGE